MDIEATKKGPTTEQNERALTVLFCGNCLLGYLLMLAGTPKILTAIPFILVGWALYMMRPLSGEEGGPRTVGHGWDPLVYWFLQLALCIAPLAGLFMLPAT